MNPPAPPLTRWRVGLRWLGWALLLVALPPSLLLVWERSRSESSHTTVAVVMDEPALADLADRLGASSLELGLQYQALGLGGIVLYEDTIATLAAKGRIAAMLGSDILGQAQLLGLPLPDVPADATLVSELVPGAAAVLLAKNQPPARSVVIEGRTWWWWPGDSLNTRPAGPDLAQVAAWHEAGFDIAYRPRNYPGMLAVGDDFPAEANYIIHAGLQVAGHPSSLEELATASQDRLTALIEGTAQDGMPELASRVPTVRLLSFNQDHQNIRLPPHDIIPRFLLAANERQVRLLYLRPYTEEQQGDMVENTETLVRDLVLELQAEGFEIGPLSPPDPGYRPSTLLRAGAGLGVLGGLLLLASAFTFGWGLLAALGVAGLGVLAGGFAWAALALMAALVFPVLGFLLLPWRWWGWLVATAISLYGAMLLAAVGSDRATMLAIEPFAGVAATLVVPPALFAVGVMLRRHSAADWVRALWAHPVRLGEVAVVLLAAAALGLVVLRRGNFPIFGASEIELTLRSTLNELFVRPRFKELIGHPLALLAMWQWRWPWWARGGLLIGGVVAQASVLNSFSHYHTPLLVSLQRSLIALAIAVVIAALLWLLVQAGERLLRRWLSNGATPRDPSEGASSQDGAPSRDGGAG